MGRDNQTRTPGLEGPLMVSSPSSYSVAGDIAADDNWCGVGTHNVKVSSTSRSMYNYYLLSTFHELS